MDTLRKEPPRQVFIKKDVPRQEQLRKEPPKQEQIRKELPKQEQPKKSPLKVEIKDSPKPEIFKKEPIKNDVKELQKFIPRKLPPKLDLKDIKKLQNDIKVSKEAIEKNKAFTPRPRMAEVKKPEEAKGNRKPYEAQDINKLKERDAKNNLDSRDVKPKPPSNFARPENIFKPVEKPIPKKVDIAANNQKREELKKQKELEAKKKLDDIMQQRENKRLEEIARQEAADKKKQEKLKKIQEDREKMMSDIKQKKIVRHSSQPNIEVIAEVEQLNLTEKTAENPQKEKKHYGEERKKMLDALRQKLKPKNDDFVVEWVGLRNPEEKRLYNVLKEAITEESTGEEDTYITEVQPVPIFDEEEEVVVRIDEIEDKEVIKESEAEAECDPDENIGSTYNSLEAMREFLEQKMGCDMLIEAYNAMKEIGDIDPLESGYSIFHEKLGNIIPAQNVEEYVSYLRSLMILENHAGSY